MGNSRSSLFERSLVYYLKQLQSKGQDFYNVDEFETTFGLNKSPRSPKCNMYLKNLFIQFRDSCFEYGPVSMKFSNIKIEIGEAVLRCDDLGYIFCISGRIQLLDVHITAEFTETSSKIKDVSFKSMVKQIKPQLHIQVNGTDRSQLVNALLSIDNSDIASNILNVVLSLQKNNILCLLNSNLQFILDNYPYSDLFKSLEL